METTPELVYSPNRRHMPLSRGDMALLESIGRFGLVTAEQLTRLHTPTRHGLRSIQRRLKRLVGAFLITCADPASIPAADLFFLPHWYQPGTFDPVRLMQPLPGPPSAWDVAADYR